MGTQATAIFIVLGMVIGTLAGLFGIGGGLLLVPALLYLFTTMPLVPADAVMQMSVGTSLAVIIFTGASATLSHVKKGKISWIVYYRLVPGIILGALLGGILAHWTPATYLKKMLGLLLLYIFFNLVSQLRKESTQPLRQVSRWLYAVTGLLIGLLSGMVGIGGGALIVPYLHYLRVDMRQISAISNACTLLIGFFGAATFATMGWHTPNLPAHSIGYIYLPAVLWVAVPSMLCAPLGAKLTYILPVKQLKYGFALMVLLIAIHLMF